MGAFSEADADQWRWFIVGIDSLKLHQFFDLSIEQYTSEELAFEVGCIALRKLKTKLATSVQG